MPDDNKQPSKHLPAVLLALAALGLPIAGVVYDIFGEQLVLQHPWRAVGWTLLYEFIVLVIGFVGKVWQKLESRWVDRAAEWFDSWTQRLFSRYRKRYLQHLFYRHRALDVKGLTTQNIYTLELQQVFVELSIAPQPIHEICTDPIRPVPAEMREGRHAIWDYLNAKPMASQNLAIIGTPGCGKTTLLKHMTLILAAKQKRQQKTTVPDKLPILLFLRNHAAALKENPQPTLAQIVHDDLEKQLKAPAGWFERQLENGRCLVMLDGLDEVADPEIRQKVANWVEQQMTTYASNRFVITSRPFGYSSNPLSGVTVLEVRPFNSEQMQSFVHNWYVANEIMSAQKDDPGVRMAAQEGAEDLLRRIRGAPTLAALAVNPLLLTMIATVHRYRSSLPGRRVELYREICEVFLGKRQQAKGLVENLTPAQKQRVLQPLAHHFMVRKERELKLEEILQIITPPLTLVIGELQENSAGDFLKLIENSSGLLLERENSVYSFAHLTFQEYLAAVHIQEQKLEAKLVEQVGNSWWHETIRLYCAQADATLIIAACLAGDPPAVPALALALECLEEAREVKPALRSQLETVLEKGVEDADPVRRRIVAEALLALRLRRMIAVDENKCIDTSLITHAEYQLFLDNRRAQGKYHQPDHWVAYQFPSGQGKMPVVGVRPSDAQAFCEWLTQRHPGKWRYRLPNAGEELTCRIIGQSTTHAGYWVVSGENCIIEMPIALIPTISTTALQKRFVVSDWDLDHNLKQALKLLRTLKRLRVLQSIRGFALGLDHARDRLRNSVREFIHDLDHARIIDSDLDFAFDLALNLVRDLGRDLGFALDLALKLFRELELDLETTLDFALTYALARDLDFVHAFAHSLDRNPNSGWRQESKSIRSFIRFFSITIAASLVKIYQAQESLILRVLSPNEGRIWKEKVKNLMESYLNLFVKFAILEERIEGKLPAFEGIRIVKERIREKSQ